MQTEASLALNGETEKRIIELVAQGNSNQEIAQELILSEHVVDRLLRGIVRKLGVADRLELILYAIVHGLSGHAEPMAAIPQTQIPEGEPLPAA
jgi:DNA-binding CsgD family transcriptional regulator